MTACPFPSLRGPQLVLTEPLPRADAKMVSRLALTIGRIIANLCRRTGYACFNFLDKLLELLAKQGIFKGLRAVRYALAELIAAGWIERRQTRKGGSKLWFRCLVQIPRPAPGMFSDPLPPHSDFSESSSSCPPSSSASAQVAGCFAGYPPEKLQFTPSTPIKTVRRGRQQHTADAEAKPIADPAAVSLLENAGLTPSDAFSVAKEANESGWTLERVNQALAYAKAKAGSLRNLGGFVRGALRGGWQQPPPPSNHPSDQSGVPVAKLVRIPKDRPFWGADRVRTSTTDIPREIPTVRPPRTDEATSRLDAAGSARCAPHSNALGVLAGQVLSRAQGAVGVGPSGLAADGSEASTRPVLSLARAEVLPVRPSGTGDRSLGVGDRDKINRIIAKNRSQGKGLG